MDFYKKIIKNKDISGVLNEKEYKCVSLQAITNEAVKENNRERLKDLVEEINGHLTDLRSIKDDKDLKNKEKCEKLIYEFEECLIRILNKPSDNVLTILNQKLEELQHLSNLAVQESKCEELRKLVEKIERNLEVVKEMPEVKDARNMEKGEDFLELVNKYEDLLKIINSHLSAKRRVVSEPMSLEVFQKVMQGNPQEQETNPPKQKKIGLNEVEEKLKLMRQKRLNRLSTFVDQQSKLSEQRSRENSPKNVDNLNKSSENLSKISESVEIETPIKSIHSPEIIKPSAFRPIAREKVIKLPEQNVFSNVDKRIIKRLEPKTQTGEVQGGNTKVLVSFKNTSGNSGNSTVGEKQSAANMLVAGSTNKIREWPKPSDLKQEKALREEDTKTQKRTSNSNMTENMGSVGETVSGVRSSFGKGSMTKSFAERQIENAKFQAVADKPKVQLKQSNSARTTPPRTPTQIKKIFNSFNSCVLGKNNNKSIEDLPAEFNSPFEQELKTVQLKSTGFDYRLEQSKVKKDDSFKTNYLDVPKTDTLKPLNSYSPLVSKRTQVPFRDKTEFAKSRAFGQQEFDNYQEQGKSLEGILDVERVGSFQASSSQGHIDKTASGYYDMVINRSNENATNKTKNSQRRLSLDFDSVTVRDHDPNYGDQKATDLLITVKRDSNTIANQPDRHSFSTFRSSTDSVKNYDENSVENPLYGVITADNKIKEKLMASAKVEIVNYNTYEKLVKDIIINCSSLEDLLKTVSRKEVRNITYIDKIKELNIILKEVKKNVKTTLDVESEKENKIFSRFLEDISPIENAIASFKGLKRDQEYLLIDKQLAKYYVEIDQIRPQSPNERSEKKCLTERLKTANKNLENKVTRNEEILRNVLDEQIKMLGEKYGIA